MEYLKTLNANQTEAALWDEGPMLVLAGPGSGKTKTLTSRVARLIEQSEGESFRILCLTFTTKAATEMRKRLYELVPQARERVLLSTFHSFAADILRQHGSHFGLTPDFEIIERAEQTSIVKHVLAENADTFTRVLSAEKALDALDFLFKNLIPDESVAGLIKDAEVGNQLAVLFAAYKARVLSQNALDYGAMLYFCERLLLERPRLAKQLRSVYKYVCVDEFQDTNLAQYKMLRALAPDQDANLFIVGDDDQIIYQWNGASPARINELGQHYNLTIIQLPENYRCPAEVVWLANALIAHNGDRASGKKPLQAMRQAASAHPITLQQFADENAEAEWVASQIAERISAGTLPHDIVVLARNSKLLSGVGRRLAQLAIEVHVQQRKTQFESSPLRLVMAALKLSIVRSDNDLASSLTKALSDCLGVDLEHKLLEALTAETNGDFVVALDRLLASGADTPAALSSAVKSLVGGDYASFLKETFAFFNAEESRAAQGSEVFADYPTEHDIWRGIVNDLGGEAEAYQLPLGQLLQEIALANKSPEAPSTAVRCFTVHGSKGMEFKHVYLVGLAEDQLPSFQAKKTGDTGREMQEERRNCFVAITRTIETLTLSYAERYNGWRKAPSRFLYEMGLLESAE